MKAEQRFAIICLIVEKLRAVDSWCGETHIQKTAYLAECLFGIRIEEYDFILYRYGPYSSELSSDLFYMTVNNQLSKKVTYPGSSYSLNVSENGSNLQEFPQFSRLDEKVEFIARAFGKHGVGYLERLCTAHWVIENRKDSPEKMADTLSGIKMHIPLGKAQEAINKALEMKEKAQNIGNK